MAPLPCPPKPAASSPAVQPAAAPRAQRGPVGHAHGGMGMGMGMGMRSAWACGVWARARACAWPGPGHIGMGTGICMGMRSAWAGHAWCQRVDWTGLVHKGQCCGANCCFRHAGIRCASRTGTGCPATPPGYYPATPLLQAPCAPGMAGMDRLDHPPPPGPCRPNTCR
jgi:hypothetical protein